MSDKQLATRSERILAAATEIEALGFGGFVSNEQIVKVSGYEKDTKEFGFFVSDVREVLVEQGMWLSGEGQQSKGFFIVRPSENAIVASRFSGKAHRALQLMQRLLERTPLTDLNEAERRRHEKELRELRYSNRLHARRDEVLEVIKKHKPGLLKDDLER
jgi:hypothetical protein